MEAAISFVIYKDFSKYVNSECDYSKAVEELNKYVKELVKNGELKITYNGKPTKIILPIEEINCGNIIEETENESALWDDVLICVKFRTNEFDSDKLEVEKCPDSWDPRIILYN